METLLRENFHLLNTENLWTFKSLADEFGGTFFVVCSGQIIVELGANVQQSQYAHPGALRP